MGRARCGACRAADCCHRAHFDRCGCGPVAMGAAARALSPDLLIVFQSRPVIPHWLAVKVQPLFILLLVVQLVDPVAKIVGAVAINIAAFFILALVCHGELAQRRPAPVHLTAFYLWMSAGGMIGGVAAALLAPAIFNWVAE